jgi:hypothetical protein
MADDEQQIAPATARAFETLSERLSRELSDASTRWRTRLDEAQQQQLESPTSCRRAEAMSASAKIPDDDFERHNEYASAVEQLMLGQMNIAQFTDGLATQYGRLFKALSNRLNAVEKEAFGPSYNQEPSTPHLN